MKRFWIAKNENGCFFIFENKPRKGAGIWLPQMETDGSAIGWMMFLNDTLVRVVSSFVDLSNLSWDDEEPTQIEADFRLV